MTDVLWASGSSQGSGYGSASGATPASGTKAAGDGKPPPSNLTVRTMRVLGAVAAAHEGIGLSELARACGVPKATCLRILRALESEQLVGHDPLTQRYYTAVGVVALFSSLFDGESAHLLVLREIRSLVDETRETGGLDVLDDDGVRVVMQIRGPELISQSGPVPRTLPETVTSTGRVLNAWRSPHQTRVRFAGRLSEDELETFLEVLAVTREHGYGWAFNELAEGAAAVACPVWVDGEVRASVWIGGPSFRITRERMPQLAERLRLTARRLEQLSSARGRWLFSSSETALHDNHVP